MVMGQEIFCRMLFLMNTWPPKYMNQLPLPAVGFFGCLLRCAPQFRYCPNARPRLQVEDTLQVDNP